MITGQSILSKEAFEEAQEKAFSLLDGLPENLTYHCKDHTKGVLAAANMLAEKSGLEDNDKCLVLMSALFHDTGYLKTYAKNEGEGANIWREFCKESKFEITEEDVELVAKAIECTDMSRDPENTGEMILRDADLYTLGYDSFLKWSNLLREEWTQKEDFVFHETAADEEKWKKQQLGFLEKHVWFTETAKELWSDQQKANVEEFKRHWKIDE